MTVSDHFRGGTTEKIVAKIITVDPPTLRVEAVGKDAAVLQVKVGVEVSPAFRWPMEGEIWTLIRENGYWTLGSRMPQSDDVLKVTDLNPGDTLALIKYAVVIGDGTSTIYTIPHGLNTPNVLITCWANSDFPRSALSFTPTVIDENTIKLTFGSPVGNDGAIVVVAG